MPSSATTAAHRDLAKSLGLEASELLGFVVAKNPKTGQFVVENISGLNVGSVGSTGMRMADDIFKSIKDALSGAGL